MKENNPDWIRRQNLCDICQQPIGHEAMVEISHFIYHARCHKKVADKLNTPTSQWKPSSHI